VANAAVSHTDWRYGQLGYPASPLAAICAETAMRGSKSRVRVASISTAIQKPLRLGAVTSSDSVPVTRTRPHWTAAVLIESHRSIKMQLQYQLPYAEKLVRQPGFRLRAPLGANPVRTTTK
jgi:hypothetical protein